jgi:phosphohistidine phosphatase SixA
MRHGEATSFALKDIDRELTDYGREQIAAMIERCESSFTMVDEIWASPYVRTQQTAALVSAAINKKTIICDFLTPTKNPDETIKALTETNNTILLVSHQPLIGTLVDDLAGLEPGRYRMRTAAVACIQSEFFMKGFGELNWLLQPET